MPREYVTTSYGPPGRRNESAIPTGAQLFAARRHIRGSGPCTFAASAHCRQAVLIARSSLIVSQGCKVSTGVNYAAIGNAAFSDVGLVSYRPFEPLSS